MQFSSSPLAVQLTMMTQPYNKIHATKNASDEFHETIDPAVLSIGHSNCA